MNCNDCSREACVLGLPRFGSGDGEEPSRNDSYWSKPKLFFDLSLILNIHSRLNISRTHFIVRVCLMSINIKTYL